jgi:hypothetical protein
MHNFFQLGLHSASRNLLALTELQSVGNVNICLDSNLGATRRVWMTVCSPLFVINLEVCQPKRTKGFDLEFVFLLEDKFEEFVHWSHFYMGFAKHTKGRNSPLNDDLLQYNAVVCRHTLCQIIIMKPRKRFKKTSLYSVSKAHVIICCNWNSQKSTRDNTVPNTVPK